MRAVSAAVIYFLIVFAAAFAFGAVRTLWLEPVIGETWAVACEVPLLIVVMVFAARFVVRRAPAPWSALALLGVGTLGLVLQQVAEFVLVLASGETVASHIAYLQTPAGLIYLAALAAFLFMPLAVGRTARE